MLDLESSLSGVTNSDTENEAMRKREDNILSYLVFQAGILSSMIRRSSSLGARIVAWVTGQKPVLIIGGEPASGKSLLMGELALRFKELVGLYPDLQYPATFMSYDRVHYLFLQRLLRVDDAHPFLPEGETHPEARKLITAVLGKTLEHARSYNHPKNTRVILEAPLIGYRGEEIVESTSPEGMQVLIVHSPAMQSRILQHEKQLGREMMSAQPLAIREIHKALLEKRGLASLPQQAQDSALIKSWEQWLDNREGLVLTWDPADDEAGFTHIKEALKANKIPPNPLAPPEIIKFATDLTDKILGEIPDREAFAAEITNCGHTLTRSV